jgi:hypothetical protein
MRALAFANRIPVTFGTTQTLGAGTVTGGMVPVLGGWGPGGGGGAAGLLDRQVSIVVSAPEEYPTV